jgi:hypothetical protein
VYHSTHTRTTPLFVFIVRNTICLRNTNIEGQTITGVRRYLHKYYVITHLPCATSSHLTPELDSGGHFIFITLWVRELESGQVAAAVLTVGSDMRMGTVSWAYLSHL